MTKSEERIIVASFVAGIMDLLFGLFMYFTGWGIWYYNHFHMFGVLGIGMVFYSSAHAALYYGDTK